MPAQKPKLKNNKKRRSKTAFKSNNVEPPVAKEYEASWKMEYEALTPEQKIRIDIATRDSKDESYKRDWFVDGFVKRVIANVEHPVETGDDGE
jgi:hypothetical protein